MDSFIMTLPLRLGIISIFMLLVWGVETTTVCNKTYHGQTMTWHTNHTGLRRCCVQRRCPAGTHALMCEEGRAETTRCVNCPEDRFQPYPGWSDMQMFCLKKKECNSIDQRILDNGSITEDRTCECDRTKGYRPSGSYCIVKPCPIGQELNYEWECETCKPGFFKNFSGAGACIQKTQCYPQEVLTHGGVETDDICKVTTANPIIVPSDPGPEDGQQQTIIICGVIGGILLVAVLIGFICLTRVGCPCIREGDQSSTGEKRSLHEQSFSDVDDSDTNTKEKAAVTATPDLRINIIPIPNGPPPYDEVSEKKTVTPDSGVFMGRTPSYTPNGVVPPEGLSPANDIVMDALPEHMEGEPEEPLEGGSSGDTGRSRHREPSGRSTADSTGTAQDKATIIFNFNKDVYMQNGNECVMNVAHGQPSYNTQNSTGSGYASGDEEEAC